MAMDKVDSRAEQDKISRDSNKLVMGLDKISRDSNRVDLDSKARVNKDSRVEQDSRVVLDSKARVNKDSRVELNSKVEQVLTRVVRVVNRATTVRAAIQ